MAEKYTQWPAPPSELDPALEDDDDDPMEHGPAAYNQLVAEGESVGSLLEGGVSTPLKGQSKLGPADWKLSPLTPFPLPQPPLLPPASVVSDSGPGVKPSPLPGPSSASVPVSAASSLQQPSSSPSTVMSRSARSQPLPSRRSTVSPRVSPLSRPPHLTAPRSHRLIGAKRSPKVSIADTWSKRPFVASTTTIMAPPPSPIREEQPAFVTVDQLETALSAVTVTPGTAAGSAQPIDPNACVVCNKFEAVARQYDVARVAWSTCQQRLTALVDGIRPWYASGVQTEATITSFWRDQRRLHHRNLLDQRLAFFLEPTDLRNLALALRQRLQWFEEALGAHLPYAQRSKLNECSRHLLAMDDEYFDMVGMQQATSNQLTSEPPVGIRHQQCPAFRRSAELVVNYTTDVLSQIREYERTLENLCSNPSATGSNDEDDENKANEYRDR